MFKIGPKLTQKCWKSGKLTQKYPKSVLFRGSNNLGVDIFPDPIGHFDEASGDPLQAVSKNPPLR